MDIKLIALDLDGTTLNEKGKLTDVTRSTLEEAAAGGVRIVVATGRPFVALPEDVLGIDAIRYVITSNGAIITDLNSDEMIYHNCMSTETAEEAVKLFDDSRYIIEAFSEGKAYIQADYYNHVRDTGECFRNAEYVLTTRQPVDDICGFILDNRSNIENINVCFEDLSIKEKIRERLLTIPKATITSSFKHNLEIGGATTSKADALDKLGKILGIGRKEIMAAGDSPNDIAMLKAAGLAVAMGNGEREVKEIADFITLPNSQNGVAMAIKKFVLRVEE